MANLTLNVNGDTHTITAEPNMPLLWVLRDVLDLTGTKYGCGIGLCGACTLLVDGKARQSCQIPVSDAVGKALTTIEGLDPNGKHPVQQAWLAASVSQCGYCQVGQIMTTAALLAQNPTPTDADIDAAFANNLCRCGTYLRIRRAIHSVKPGG